MDVEYIKSTLLTNNLLQKSKKCKSITNSITLKMTREDVTSRRPSVHNSDAMARPRMPSAILLAIGGWSGGNPTNGIEAYDIRANSWRNVTDELEPPRAYHGSVFLDGYVYCIGGFDRFEHFNSVRRFDPTSRTWEEVAPMYCRRCYVSVTVLEGCIYAMGGFNGQVRLKSAEVYCPELNQWSYIAPMHEQRSDASCTSFQGKVGGCELSGVCGNFINI